MIYKTLKAGSYTYPLNSIHFCILRIRFFKHILFNFNLIKSFIQGIEKLGYLALFEHKIPVLGAVEWSYIHKDWDIKRRFDTILGHYQIIKTLPQILDVADGKPKVLVDTDQFSVATKIVLDKAQWFVREGEIVLNLFKGECRILSIAFTISDHNGERVMYIGAIQGIHADENSLEKIKSLTKDFEGLRPRDFLMEVLRMLAKEIGVQRILGVSDAYRHYHHSYFSKKDITKIKMNYDSIWQEQDAELFGYDFYSIPLQKERRLLSEVSSNKRAMYRRRYEILDEIKYQISFLFENKRIEVKSPVVEDNIHHEYLKNATF